MNKIVAFSLAATLALSTAPAFAEAMTASQAFDDLGKTNYVSIVPTNSSSDNQIIFSGGRIDFLVDIAALQARVSQNPRVASLLANAGYSPTDVVGIESSGEESVTLYVR